MSALSLAPPPKTKSHYFQRLAAVNSELITPDSAALSCTGDVRIRAVVRLPDWTPTGTHNFVSKRVSSSGEYIFAIAGGSFRLVLQWYEGSTLVSANCLTLPTVADGAWLGVSAQRDNNGGTAGLVWRCIFFTKASSPETAQADILNDAGWVQLGAVVDGIGIANPTDTTNAVLLGSPALGGAGNVVDIAAVGIWSDLGVTLVANPDITHQKFAARTFVDAQGNRWLMNGAGLIT